MLAVRLALHALVLFLSRFESPSLSWDGSQESFFFTIDEYDTTQTLSITQVIQDSVTYEFVDSIYITSPGALSMTITAWMTFEEPIDDIKEAVGSADYRGLDIDLESISREKAAEWLALVHNGTLEYDRASTWHIMADGTTAQSVKWKYYPTTLSCPNSCKNPYEDPDFANYGVSGCSAQACIVYNCEYNLTASTHWGAGICEPLAVDENVTLIETMHQSWWAKLKSSNVDYQVELIWGKSRLESADAAIYPDRWFQKYYTYGGNELDDRDCNTDGTIEYWDSGYHSSQHKFFSPTLTLANEFRKVSYSLHNISVTTAPASISVDIGGYSESVPTDGVATTIAQALSDKLSYQKLVLDDIGLHYIMNSMSLSNASDWLLINKSYFGYACNELMVDQWAWYDSSCATPCMDHVLSAWSQSVYGISTLPYYANLDLTGGIDDAVSVKSNVSIYSTDNILIDFKFTYSTASINISSANFAIKQPNVCSANTFIVGQQSNVSFTNCGQNSADFQYTIGCANGQSTTTSAETVAASAYKISWLSTIPNPCDAITSVNITTSPCPAFWTSCIWSTTITTMQPTTAPSPSPTTSPSDAPTSAPTCSPTSAPTTSPSASPTDVPSLDPTITPTYDPSSAPTMTPTYAPTATPVSFFDSCTVYQVLPVRGAVNNVIIHQEFCVPPRQGHYIIDLNAKKPYYVVADAVSTSNTTLNTINISDYATGTNSGVPASGSALIGHSIIYIEDWYDVLGYLEMDLSAYSTTQSIPTSIKISALNISTDIPSVSLQASFVIALKQQLLSALSVDVDQLMITNLRDGSIIADMLISSTSANTKSAIQINIDLQNYIASSITTTPSLSSPLNTVGNFFYANKTNDIVFKNCPYRITATTWEDETVSVSWDTPAIKTRADDSTIDVYKVIGESSGASFSAGSYFIRYVALSSSDPDIVPKYCSFVIVVDEKEWVISFIGAEFSLVEVIIIGTCLVCICMGSIIYSVVMRRRGYCCRRPSHNIAATEDGELASETDSGRDNDPKFKSVIVSSYDTA